MYKKDYILGKKLFLQGESLRSIQRNTGINRKKLSFALMEDGVKGPKRVTTPTLSRNPAKSKYDFSGDLAQKVIKKYTDGGISINKIAESMGIGSKIVRDFLIYNGVDTTHNSSGKYYYNTDIFKLVDTEDKAYWLGFLFADSYIVSEVSHHLELTITAKDRNHLEKFQLFMGTDSAIHDKTVELKGKSYKAVRIFIYNKEIINDLMKLGLKNGKFNRTKFPAMPDELTSHFMRGYFDGDGCIGRYSGQLRFSLNGNKEFLIKFDSILRPFGVNKTKLGRDGKSFRLSHGGNMQAKKVLNFLYKDATIFLPRKSQVFAPLLSD